MNSGAKLAALNKFRGTNSMIMRQQPTPRILVVYDVQVKAPDVFQVPLVINYGESAALKWMRLIMFRFAQGGRRIRAPRCASYLIKLCTRRRGYQFRHRYWWRRGNVALYRVFLQVSSTCPANSPDLITCRIKCVSYKARDDLSCADNDFSPKFP